MRHWLNGLTAIVLSLMLVACPPMRAQENAAAPASESDLKAGAEQIAAKQLKAMGSAYSAYVDAKRHLVFVSGLGEQDLKAVIGLMEAFADRLNANLSLRPPAWNITVLLPTADDYKKLAPRKDVVGFYQPDDRTIISIDRGGTLLHEFVHALHHADQAAAKQVHPLWIDEGLATLFESGTLTADGLTPSVDTRLLTIKKLLKDDKVLGLEQIAALKSDDFASDAPAAYAQSRYLMLYLYERGVLAKWYEAYKEGYADDATGLKAMQKVLKQRTFEIEADWRKWAAGLELPWKGKADQGRLGVEMKDDTAGVVVVSLIENGPAAKAGKIQTGDVIQKFNGREVRSCAEIVSAIRAAAAGQTASLELLRGGQHVTIAQPLGSGK